MSVPGRRTGAAAPPWYAAGLRFECTACGACCTGEPGYVWVTPEEIAGMARAKGMSVRRFHRAFVRRVGRRLSLREREGGDCAMLGADRRCTVYAAKPLRCTTFPFWPEAIQSRETWAETAERCEGVGRGPRFEQEEIERVADGDPSPLLEKQAASLQGGAGAQGAGPEGGQSREQEAEEPEGAQAEDGPEAQQRAVPEAVWSAALLDLERLYAELDRELPRWRFTCAASGNCCDFGAYGHRLYATTLEAERFFRSAPPERQNQDEGHCPAWGPDRLCKAREGRMLGCRTYFCGPWPVGRPEELHEPWHAKIRALHERHGIPYRYRDVLDWSRERRPVP